MTEATVDTPENRLAVAETVGDEVPLCDDDAAATRVVLWADELAEGPSGRSI